MEKKSSAHYQREYRRRLREQGLVKKEVWVHPSNAKLLSRVEKQLRAEQVASESSSSAIETQGLLGEGDMQPQQWSTSDLYQAMLADELFVSGVSVELIDGAESAIHLCMREYGDLPIFLTVSGEQIIVEALLWEVSEVKSLAEFNDTVLRTHKYFPLSTIGLEEIADGKSYYYMFGALSATSIFSNVIFEIESLAANVIHATEAYADYLKTPLGSLAS